MPPLRRLPSRQEVLPGHSEQEREVGFLFGVCIFLFPFLAILTLRKGYGAQDRLLSLFWLFFIGWIFFMGIFGQQS